MPFLFVDCFIAEKDRCDSCLASQPGMGLRPSGGLGLVLLILIILFLPGKI